MRVGFGATVLAKGMGNNKLDGIGYYSQELADSLSQNDIDLKPIVFGSTAIHELFRTPLRILPDFKCGLGINLLGMDYPASKKLNSEIDLYHATDHIIPRFKKIPTVATIMDAIPLVRPQWTNQRLRSLKNLVWKRTVSWVDHVITISEYSKRDLIEIFDIPSKKITVTPLGVDRRYFDPVLMAASNDYLGRVDLESGKFFLFVGTLQPRKNIETLLLAYSQLPAHIRCEIPLVVVGRVGWGCSDLVIHLTEYASKNGSKVKWLKEVTDLEKRILMQNATALVFPSLYEGFGLPVLEAFASGLPVITSTTTSLPEVASGAALLIDPTNMEQLAHEMERVVEENGLRAELKAKGLERARAFTWSRCAAETMKVYRKMLSI